VGVHFFLEHFHPKFQILEIYLVTSAKIPFFGTHIHSLIQPMEFQFELLNKILSWTHPITYDLFLKLTQIIFLKEKRKTNKAQKDKKR